MAERKTILNGAAEIKAVLGCGNIMFKRYKKMGLPVKKIGRILVAHRNSIEDFIKNLPST